MGTQSKENTRQERKQIRQVCETLYAITKNIFKCIYFQELSSQNIHLSRHNFQRRDKW